MVRNPEHITDLEQDGVEPALIDLEDTDVDEMTEVVRGADAVLFAAGGGPDGNAAAQGDRRQGRRDHARRRRRGRGRTSLRDGLRDGHRDADPDSDDVFQVYLRAKQAADDDVRGRDLDWTIVRPGRLIDDVPTGPSRSATSSAAR